MDNAVRGRTYVVREKILPQECGQVASMRNLSQRHSICVYNRSTYVEIGLYKRELAHGDVHRGILCRIPIRGPSVVKNG